MASVFCGQVLCHGLFITFPPVWDQGNQSWFQVRVLVEDVVLLGSSFFSLGKGVARNHLGGLWMVSKRLTKLKILDPPSFLVRFAPLILRGFAPNEILLNSFSRLDLLTHLNLLLGLLSFSRPSFLPRHLPESESSPDLERAVSGVDRGLYCSRWVWTAVAR